MENNIKMHSRDAISASLAECFITIDGSRYNFMQAIDIEVKFEPVKVEIPILGVPGKGNKKVGWKGTGSATFHYNSSIFRKLMERYQDTGEDMYFDMQITNYDPSNKLGRQTVILYDCNLDNGILAKFDASGEYLDESMDFTFERFKVPEEFKMLEGMI